MKKISIFSLILLAFISLGLKSGDPAPDFTAKNQNGKTIHLSDFKGHPVLVYFYPKDDTLGCTKEACSFRDEYSKYKKHGAVILGVSRQDGKSHQAFREKYKLPFDLLVDTDGSLGKQFGVGQMPVIGLEKRQSLLIDGKGMIVRFYDNVDPTTHSAQVLKDLDAIQSN
jgi:peroxiredoxin Q/BCP